MSMRAWVDDEGWVLLDDAALVAEGGQGRVYARGARAYKIAGDPAAVLDPRKLAALSLIACAHVVKPEASIRAAPGGSIIGHAMRRVERVVPWMQLVPRAARARLGLDQGACVQLLGRLQTIVSAVHDAGIAIVDLSGGNVLVDPRRRQPYLIDIDSAALPGFPATAITPQIADPTAAGRHGIAGDWFALAVLGFELLCGIHPFRGTHPHVHGLHARMAAGISVLDPAVHLPPACDDPQALPAGLRQWFDGVFRGHVRAPAPLGTTGTRRVAPRPSTPGTCALARSDGAMIRGVFAKGPTWWWTDTAIGCGDRIVGATPPDAVGLIACPVPGGVAMLCHGEAGALAVVRPGDVRGTSLGVTVSEVRVDAGAVIVRCGDRIGLLDLRAAAGVPWASLRMLGKLGATQRTLWPGCVTSAPLGRAQVTAVGPGAHASRALPEIGAMRIVDAVATAGIAMVLVTDGHRHDRWCVGLCARWAGVAIVERDVDPTDCAIVCGPDGTPWIRVAAGLALLAPGGALGPALDLGAGTACGTETGAIRVAHDHVWALTLPGAAAQPDRQTRLPDC